MTVIHPCGPLLRCGPSDWTFAASATLATFRLTQIIDHFTRKALAALDGSQ